VVFFLFHPLWRLFQTKAFQMLGVDVTPSVSLPPFWSSSPFWTVYCQSSSPPQFI
jgi:hypothetical protein